MFPINRLSIQSKLILMLLGVSVTSIMIISILGYVFGRNALNTAAYNQLLGIRAAKGNQIREQLSSLRNDVISLAESGWVTSAMRTFREGYKELESAPITAEMDEKLTGFYRKEFLPELAKSIDSEPVLETYLPQSSVSRYLQYHYLANNIAAYESKQILEVAPDNSAFSAAHARYHPMVDRIAKRFKFQDVMFVDAQTLDVVYSYQKTVEFATNLDSGPYSDSNLGRLCRSIRRAMDRGDYKFADFEHYRPNL